VRLDIHANDVKFATRCSSTGYQTVTVGVETPVTVSDGDLAIAGSGGSFTRTGAGPSGKPPMNCTAKLTGPGSTPYSLLDGELDVFGMEFTKIAD